MCKKSNVVENLMISANGQNLKTVINKEGEYPSIEVWTCDKHGAPIELVSLTEINTVDNNISIIGYVEGEEDFKNKTIFKDNI